MRPFDFFLAGLLTTTALLQSGCGGTGSIDPPTQTPPPTPPPPTTGTLTVHAVTQGVGLDPDGYLISVDGGEPIAASANSAVASAPLAAGDHQVLVTGLACNCTAIGDNPRTVTVSAGQSLEVSFDFLCASRAAEPVAFYLSDLLFNGLHELVARNSQILIASARRRSQPISSGQQPSGPLRWTVMNFDSTRPVHSKVFSDSVQFLQQPYGMMVETDGTARVLLDRFTQNNRTAPQDISLQIASIQNAFSASPSDPSFDVIVAADDLGTPQGLQLLPGPLALYQNVTSTSDVTTYASRRSGTNGAPTINALDSSSTRRYFSAATSGAGYLVASLDYSNFSFGRLEVQTLSPEGAPIGARTTLDDNAISQLSPTPPSISWCGDRYAIVYWGQLPYGPNNTTHAQLRAVTLDANGVQIQPVVNLTGDIDVTTEFELEQPAILCESGASLAIAYAPSSDAIEFARTDLNLQRQSARTLNAPNRLMVGTSPRLFADEESYVVTWVQGQSVLGFSRFCRY